MKLVEEKLKKTESIKERSKKEDNKINSTKHGEKILIDLTSFNDDFRNFNIYIPKIKINETAKNKTTFSLANDMNPQLDRLPPYIKKIFQELLNLFINIEYKKQLK